MAAVARLFEACQFSSIYVLYSALVSHGSTMSTGDNDITGALSVRIAGLRSGDLEGAVANNASIYGLNAVVLATFAGLSAYNPALVGVKARPLRLNRIHHTSLELVRKSVCVMQCILACRVAYQTFLLPCTVFPFVLRGHASSACQRIFHPH
jgi:hypothetical protein